MGEDSNQRGGPRGGGTQDLTDDYDLEGQHDGVPRRGRIWTVRRFTDSSDLWKDTLDTLTACGVPVDRLLTRPRFSCLVVGEHHFLEGFIFLSNPGDPAQVLRGRG